MEGESLQNNAGSKENEGGDDSPIDVVSVPIENNEQQDSERNGVGDERRDGENAEVGDEEDEELITQEELVKQLILAWRNEQCAPRLLPHKENLVSAMVAQLEVMEANFKECSDQVPPLALAIHKMEAVRLAYITSDYLRTRLKKIENYPEALIKDFKERRRSDRSDLFSIAELEFAKGFAELRKDHFHEVLLDQIPPAYAHVPVSPIDVANEGVVFEATLRYPRTLQIEGSSSERKDVTVYPGSINLLPFSAVKGLIEDDALALL